jgi:hypothetical protein
MTRERLNNYTTKGTIMSIENIIRAWKADEENWEASLVASPIGQELTEEELLEVSGSDCVITNCGVTCSNTCGTTCGTTVGGGGGGGCTFFTL